MKRIELEASRMVRVLSVLREYVQECDDLHGEERAILPLARYVTCVLTPLPRYLLTHDYRVF